MSDSFIEFPKTEVLAIRDSLVQTYTIKGETSNETIKRIISNMCQDLNHRLQTVNSIHKLERRTVSDIRRMLEIVYADARHHNQELYDETSILLSIIEQRMNGNNAHLNLEQERVKYHLAKKQSVEHEADREKLWKEAEKECNDEMEEMTTCLEEMYHNIKKTKNGNAELTLAFIKDAGRNYFDTLEYVFQNPDLISEEQIQKLILKIGRKLFL